MSDRSWLFIVVLAILTTAVALRGGSEGAGGAQDAGPKEVRFLGCYDGDTCVFDAWDEPVRLARIDTPELGGECAVAATLARIISTELLRRARVVRVDSLGTGRYGRVIGEVYADGGNVSEVLLETQLAAGYGESPCKESVRAPVE